MHEIPDFILPYLWDTRIDKISLTENARFIIERVLENGNEKAIKWLNETFSKDKIIETLMCSRRISPKTGNFYASIYNIDPNGLVCIRKPFTQKQNRF